MTPPASSEDGGTGAGSNNARSAAKVPMSPLTVPRESMTQNRPELSQSQQQQQPQHEQLYHRDVAPVPIAFPGDDATTSHKRVLRRSYTEPAPLSLSPPAKNIGKPEAHPTLLRETLTCIPARAPALASRPPTLNLPRTYSLPTRTYIHVHRWKIRQ